MLLEPLNELALIRCPPARTALNKIHQQLSTDTCIDDSLACNELALLLMAYFDYSEEWLDDEDLEDSIHLYGLYDEIEAIVDFLDPLFAAKWDRLLKVDVPDTIGNLHLYFLN